jgi:hypothetical protein
METAREVEGAPAHILTEGAVREEFALIMLEWGYSHAPEPTAEDICRVAARHGAVVVT